MDYYTVYEITNNINDKIYIGIHKTSNLNDGYMGSGKYIRRAITKYGIENFTKKILFIFNNDDSMREKEKELVTEEFIKDPKSYNLVTGGGGGFNYINDNKLNDRTGMVHSPESRSKMSVPKTEEQKQKQSQMMMGNTLYKNVDYINHPCNLPKSEEYRKKISQGLYNSKKKHNSRPRAHYTIRTPGNTIDTTTNLVKYCKERSLNYGYMKQGTKGYIIIEKTALRDIASMV